jgi:curli biogenesis system outer membrane secretion channel CsgG
MRKKAPMKRLTTFAVVASLLATPAATLHSSEGATSLKRKVAIARFTNETRSGQSFMRDEAGDRLGKQASDILSARLSSTGAFMMFERSDSTQISAEQMLAGLEESGVAVDYLILGSVSEFGRSVESVSGVFSRAKAQRAYAKVNVRLVDVETGRIVHSAEGAGEAVTETKKTLGVGSSAGFDQSLTDKAISAAISQVTGNLITTMQSKPWKSYILAFDEGAYVIAGGSSQGLRDGMILSIKKKGKRIKNPQTGATIELPGKDIGTLKVLMSFGEDEFNEVSYANLISGDIDDDLSEYFLTELR